MRCKRCANEESGEPIERAHCDFMIRIDQRKFELTAVRLSCLRAFEQLCYCQTAPAPDNRCWQWPFIHAVRHSFGANGLFRYAISVRFHGKAHCRCNDLHPVYVCLPDSASTCVLRRSIAQPVVINDFFCLAISRQRLRNRNRPTCDADRPMECQDGVSFAIAGGGVAPAWVERDQSPGGKPAPRVFPAISF